MGRKRFRGAEVNNGEEAKRNKEATSDDENDLCKSCNKPADGETIQCDWCGEWEHKTCAKLSDNHYKLLNEPSPNIMFFCSSCHPKVKVTLEASYNINELHISLDKRLKLIEEKLSKIPDNLSDHLSQCSLLQPIQDMQIQDPQSSIQNTSNSISDISPNKISSAVVSLLNDEKEREKRCMNIIIHNLPESTAKTGEERKQDDISKITEMCNQNLETPTSVTNAVRLGKKSTDPNKPRIIKVTVGSKRERAKILSKCTNLRNPSMPSHLKKVFITPDLT